ncbi:hypothetical protein ACFL46_02305 [Candidatus Neomarinimicrobiota bacterium]
MRSSKIVFTTLLVLGMLGSLVFAKELDVATKRLDKTFGVADVNFPDLSTLNINNIQVWVQKNGQMPPQGANGSSADYPKGTTNFIYAEGMVWGVKVNDGEEPRLRVGGSTYDAGTVAGKVVAWDGTPGSVSGASGAGLVEDPADRHMWRVRPDYNVADLTEDAAGFYQVATADVSADQVQNVYDQYHYDWNNWPGEDGAPFIDSDGDGVYTAPAWQNNAWVGDIPGFPGAGQTLWTVCNDLPGQDGVEVAPNIYGSPGIGFEEQLTVWAYAFAANNPLGNIQFKRARIIYTGKPDGDATAKIDTAYFTQWSDPDLGTYTDDYVGFDTTLSFGYVYNGNTLDATYNGTYGLAVPAGGYDFLQGPKVDGVPLPMTSCGYFGAGSEISDPTQGSYSGTNQWFNLMEGFLPRPEYPEQIAWTDQNGDITKFPLAGNPVDGSGDIDGVVLPPGDRRLLMTAGPFEMVVGDTQDVVLALVGGLGGDNLSSVTVAKYFDIFAQFAYDNDFNLPSPPSSPLVTAFPGDAELTLNWGADAEAVAATEVPVNSGFAFEGYKVYQLPSYTASSDEGVLVASFDVINGVITITEQSLDESTGLILELPAHAGSDGGIQRYFNVDRDYIRNRPITNDRPYYYGVSAYSYLADNANSPFKSLESGLARITVTPNTGPLGVEYNAGFMDGFDATHSAGSAGGAVAGNVIDQSALTGHSYKVWFDQQHYYLDAAGVWQKTDAPAAGKLLDVSPSVITGVAETAPGGTMDLIFTADIVSPDYNYAAGVKIMLPAGAHINSVNGNGLAAMVASDGSNTVMFGDTDVDGGGDFAGGEVFSININSMPVPIPFDFVVYDDGWATLWCPDNVDACLDYEIGEGFTETINAEGSGSITELSFASYVANQWNLQDTNSGKDVLEAQTTYGGIEFTPYNQGGVNVGTANVPIVDGVQLDVNVGFAAPFDFASYNVTLADGSTDFFSHARASAWLDYDQHGKPYIWDSYADHGWGAFGPSATAWDSYEYGDDGAQHGTQETLILQNDYEFRFTGVLGDPVGSYTPIQDGTGSLAVIVGARGYDLADHPDPDNPGTGDPFFIRIPFEVWDIEADKQVSIVIYDRLNDPSTDMQAINPSDRMYVWINGDDYDATLAKTAVENSNSDLMTWNLIFWNCAWTTGDVVHLAYDNPIAHGSDEWAFSTSAPSSVGITDDDVDMINVFPNPYYGTHELEVIRSNKYVTFNHLPQVAEIRIFNLGGNMVAQIEKDDETQYATWDLKNQFGYPVASGVYVMHITLPDLDKEKILKFALVQEEQILISY